MHKAAGMLEKMGWQKGTTLGKSGQEGLHNALEITRKGISQQKGIPN